MNHKAKGTFVLQIEGSFGAALTTKSGTSTKINVACGMKG